MSAILDIMFWNFATFQYWFDLPQVKWYLISSAKIILHELPNDFPNNLRLTIIEKL